MSSRRKLLLGIGGFYLFSIIAVIVIFGAKRQDNPAFKPQNEFKLDNWIPIHLGSSPSTRPCSTCSPRRSSRSGR